MCGSPSCSIRGTHAHTHTRRTWGTYICTHTHLQLYTALPYPQQHCSHSMTRLNTWHDSRMSRGLLGFGESGAQVCVRVCAYVCVRVCVNVYICVCVCLCIYIHLYDGMTVVLFGVGESGAQVCGVCVCVCVCVCACVYIYTCIFCNEVGIVWGGSEWCTGVCVRVLCAMSVCFVCVSGMTWLVCVWCVRVSYSSCDMRA